MPTADGARSGVVPWVVWTALGALAAALAIGLVSARLGADFEPASALDRALLLYGVGPRIATAILVGAALGLAGALMQAALDNPLAEPATLGVSAGAQLGLGLLAIAAPDVGGFAREGAAFLGGTAAVALVIALSWRRGLDPVTVVLCGMIVATIASGLSAALILANGDYLFALLIWGGGSLVQQGWGPAWAIGAALITGGLGAALLARALGVLSAGESGARSLGAPVGAIRTAALGLGVLLATTVAAEVGLIAFVGLAAPALARLSGARSTRHVLLAAPATGAILLWLTDGAVQQFGTGDALPTGAATAFLGAPLLLWMLPRLRMADRPGASVRPGPRSSARFVALFAALAFLVFAAALALGRGPDGWSIATGGDFLALLPFRLPRAAAAAAAGAMLAAAGVVLQRLTANPLASPEVLGVGAGAGVGLAVVLVTAGAASAVLGLAGAACGAMAALLLMLALATRSRLGPERLLLAGAAISALCLAVVNAVIAGGSAGAFALLGWISGSTSAVGPSEAIAGCLAAVVLIAALAPLRRWLDVLPLGETVARGVGLELTAARAALTIIAALLTACASLIAGPLSFVGLVAPHMAYAAGLTRPALHLAGAVALGAGLMVSADLLGRTVIYPYQLPLGLFASLIGGGYLLLALRAR
ncbi:MAG TPA: Fe(3+)-hydroxamate ABC transporter permease FhuB [Hansschlegelia sp.]